MPEPDTPTNKKPSSHRGHEARKRVGVASLNRYSAGCQLPNEISYSLQDCCLRYLEAKKQEKLGADFASRDYGLEAGLNLCS